MNIQTLEIKEGIKFHHIKADRYKTDLTYISLMVPIKREYITRNALVPLMLKRGSEKYKDQYELSNELDNLYGASYSAGVDKKGDNLVLKFSMDSLNNRFSIDGLNIIKEVLNMAFNVIFNPLLEDGKFKEEYLEIEKEHLKKIINSKIDDKDTYATDSCVSIMYGEEGFGIYKYGYVEDIDGITTESLTEYYNWLINNAKIDVFVSSQSEFDELKSYVLENESIKKLPPRKNPFIKYDEVETAREVLVKPKVVTECMDVTQGKLVIGYDIRPKDKEFLEKAIVYNDILGGSATSFLFQNVREKAGLCYTARSSLSRPKLGLFIKCGIQIENYDKTLELIGEQIEMLKRGEFSEEDLENAKAYVVAALRTYTEDQATELIYYVGCELSGNYKSLDEHIEDVQKVTREDIISIANSVFVNTIYFLKNVDEE